MLIGLKAGVFALVRFVLPVLTEAVIQWQTYIIALSVAGVLYTAVLALKQVDLRRLLAFVVVSHSSVMIMGLFSLEHRALQVSILLAAHFGLVAAGLLFLTGMIHQHTGTLFLGKLSGLFHSIPLIGIGLLVAGLSITGVPGTPGSDAAQLVLDSAIVSFGALPVILVALGYLVAAGFLLFAFLRALLSPGDKHLSPLTAQKTLAAEGLITGSLILILLFIGYYSAPWMKLTDASLRPLSALLMHH